MLILPPLLCRHAFLLRFYVAIFVSKTCMFERHCRHAIPPTTIFRLFFWFLRHFLLDTFFADIYDAAMRAYFTPLPRH